MDLTLQWVGSTAGFPGPGESERSVQGMASWGRIGQTQEKGTRGERSRHWPHSRQGCFQCSACFVFKSIALLNYYLHLEYSTGLTIHENTAQ